MVEEIEKKNYQSLWIDASARKPTVAVEVCRDERDRLGMDMLWIHLNGKPIGFVWMDDVLRCVKRE